MKSNEEKAAYMREYNQKRKEKGLCIKCGTKLDREGLYCSRCLVPHNQSSAKAQRKFRTGHHGWRRQAMEKIAGGVPTCVRCGCTVYSALEINHINGGGSQETKLRPLTMMLLDIIQGRRTIEDLEITCIVCNRAHYAEMKTGLKWEVKFLG